MFNSLSQPMHSNCRENGSRIGEDENFRGFTVSMDGATKETERIRLRSNWETVLEKLRSCVRYYFERKS